MGPDKGFGDVWDTHASEPVSKDHFDISHVLLMEVMWVLDDGYEDVWVSHVIVVHDRGMEVSS